MSLEYCPRDEFAPSCGRDEVIVMTEALFGRMRIGRCITRDRGYIGCQTDIRYRLDKICSNKPQCRVDVIDIDLKNSTCDVELKQYLEADYYCQKGQDPLFV